MKTYAVILTLVSIPVGIFGLANIVKPLGWVALRRRRHAIGVFCGALAALWLGVYLGAFTPAGELSPAQKAGLIRSNFR